MLSAMVAFPCYGNPLSIAGRTQTKVRSHIPLKLRASLFEYPLGSRIIVTNLPFSTIETSLWQEFSNFGSIAEVDLVKDAATKRSKGYAFIQYSSQDDAILALETMDQKNFNGRMICVELSRPGKDAFGGRPRTSGPPRKWNFPAQEDIVDCWY